MIKKLSLRELIFKKMNPTQLLAISFLFVIFFGAFLLSLPISNKTLNVSFIDHLFTAVSSTCVTGLLTVNVKEQYTLFGQIVIMILIQIGGLGLMTVLVTLIALSKQRLLIAEKKLIKDSLNKSNFQDIPKYIKGIIRYTLVFEFIGFLIFSSKFIKEFGLKQGLFNSLFLSISSFNNAGIDNFSDNSIMMYATNPLIVITICILIVFGGLGFSVWFNLSDYIKSKLKKSLKRVNLTLHTKLVLTMTILLLISGTLLFILFEYNNTMYNFSFFDKILIGFFQSTTLRTAGFFSVNMSSLRTVTVFMMCLFMLIGGSPGSTAGGIKTTTFATLIIIFISIIKENGQHYRIFKRDLPKDILNRSFSIITIYLVSLILALFILLSTENFSFISLLFESISAIATVGLSLGITQMLSIVGKIVIMLLMFIGRVGPITIVYSLLNNIKKSTNITYANEDTLIG